MNKSLYFFILLFMFSITSCGVFQKEEEEKKIETHSTDFNFVEIILDWFPNANHAGLYSAIKYDHFTENRINISNILFLLFSYVVLVENLNRFLCILIHCSLKFACELGFLLGFL